MASRHKTTIKISSRSPIDDVCRPRVHGPGLQGGLQPPPEQDRYCGAADRSVDPVSTGENVLHSGVGFRYDVDELTGL